MLSEDEIKQHLSSITTNIGSVLKAFSDDIDNKIINEQESKNLYYELETVVKQCLEKVFGPEDDTSSNALSSAFLTYDSTVNQYSDAVLFNYWSHKGEPIETPIRTITGRWRDNIYYKGVRWSDEDAKSSFYTLFNIIKSALQGKAPVDFFTEHGVECNTSYLKIIGRRITAISEMTQSSPDRQIVIPILIGSDKVINSELFKQLLRLIGNMRDGNKNKKKSERLRKDKQSDIENIEDLIRKASTEAEEKDFELLHDIKKGFINGLTSDLEKTKALEGTIKLRDVFNVVIAYQYYDHPYDIHMFLPTANHEKLYSCLVISVEEGNDAISPYVQSFIALVDALGKITRLERMIWEKMKDNLPIYWKWKEHYENFSDQHSRLSNVAMNICRAICRKENLDVVSIPARLKEFDSFYNKIVSRANSGDVTTSEDNIDYKTAILSPTDKNAEKIFGDLKDVVGLRMICLYNAEKNKISDKFKELSTNGEIENYKSDSIVDPLGYKSIHISFSLGSKRCGFYELNDLRERKCEIQIRTILEEGWADISHRFVYKPGVPKGLIKKIEQEIKNDLIGTSASLTMIEKIFQQIVDTVKKYQKTAT